MCNRTILIISLAMATALVWWVQVQVLLQWTACLLQWGKFIHAVSHLYMYAHCRSPTGFSSKQSFHSLLLWHTTFCLHRRYRLTWKESFVCGDNCRESETGSPRIYIFVPFLKSIRNVMANLGFGVLCSKLQWQWTWVSPIPSFSFFICSNNSIACKLTVQWAGQQGL